MWARMPGKDSRVLETLNQTFGFGAFFPMLPPFWVFKEDQDLLPKSRLVCWNGRQDYKNSLASSSPQSINSILFPKDFLRCLFSHHAFCGVEHHVKVPKLNIKIITQLSNNLSEKVPQTPPFVKQ